MANPRLVFVGLETTGFDARSDRIVELGAVRMADGEVVERFSRLCDPGVELPPVVTQVTGIAAEDLRDQPTVEAILPEFLEFLGDDICVSHDAAANTAFLEQALGGPLQQPMVCSLLLAQTVLPTQRNHRLATLARHFGLADAIDHRAAAEAEMIARLWQHLMAELRGLPLAVLNEMSQVVAGLDHPMRVVIAEAQNELQLRNLGNESSFESLLENFTELVTYRPDEEDPDAPRQEGEDPQKTLEVLRAGGLIAQHLNDYEERPEQTQMAGDVAAALQDGRHLIAEAATGVGKSLAYLVPCVLHALKTGERVVISTHTKNLQAQLFFKDLPLVARTLGVEIKAALIKGRQNYLCLRRFMNTIREDIGELDAAERLALLPVIAWAATTRSGDIEECIGLQQVAPQLRERLVTSGEECLGRSSPFFRQCFPRMNRGKALQADIIVANHSLVFSELMPDSVVLPPHQVVVFDEAHNIESVATEHLAVRVNRFRLIRILSRLYRRPRGKFNHGSGLLVAVAARVDAAMRAGTENLDAIAAQQTRQAAQKGIEAVQPVYQAMDAFFESLAPLCEGQRDPRVRLERETVRKDDYAAIDEAKGELIRAGAKLIKLIEAVLTGLRQLREYNIPYVPDFIKELEAQIGYLHEFVDDLGFVLALNEEDYVYWVDAQNVAQARYELAAAPLDVAELLHAQIYSRKRSVIMVSATMSVSQSFDFMKRRLGLSLVEEGGLGELRVGSPFNFDQQCRFVLPNYLPDPNSPRFTDATAEMILEVFTETRGRGLALFTSYAMMRKAAAVLRPRLAALGIPMYVQGQDGSRQVLLEQFGREVNSVLLGTSSFWEGIDVKGDALSALVVVKIPFDVPTDPIVKARCDRIQAEGGVPFMEYSVPMAVLRLRQGFGRLIRSTTDRGIVVVADNRLLKSRYGKVFLRSLPTRHRIAYDEQGLRGLVGQFMNAPAGPPKPVSVGRLMRGSEV